MGVRAVAVTRRVCPSRRNTEDTACSTEDRCVAGIARINKAARLAAACGVGSEGRCCKGRRPSVRARSCTSTSSSAGAGWVASRRRVVVRVGIGRRHGRGITRRPGCARSRWRGGVWRRCATGAARWERRAGRRRRAAAVCQWVAVHAAGHLPAHTSVPRSWSRIGGRNSISADPVAKLLTTVSAQRRQASGDAITHLAHLAGAIAELAKAKASRGRWARLALLPSVTRLGDKDRLRPARQCDHVRCRVPDGAKAARAAAGGGVGGAMSEPHAVSVRGGTGRLGRAGNGHGAHAQRGHGVERRPPRGRDGRHG